MQATTDVLQKGFSQIFDAMMVPNSSPGINPQRARQLQQQAEQDRQAEEQRHERLIGSLKLLGYSASPAAPSLQNNPLGLKLGRSAQTDQSTDASADGLRPAGTAFFGLGGNGNPAIGATNNAPANAPSDRLGNDTTAANQLLTATGGRSGAVFDGKGVTGKSLVKPLDFKRLAVSIKENTEFLKLNQKRNESIALFEQLQTQIAALRLKLAVPGADTAIMDARIREMEARQRQAEVYVDYTNQEMKHQFKVDVEEQ